MEFLLQLRRVAVGNDFIWMLAYREERPLTCIFHKMYKNKNQFKMTKNMGGVFRKDKTSSRYSCNHTTTLIHIFYTEMHIMIRTWNMNKYWTQLPFISFAKRGEK